jgi:hypothetical protein
MASTDDTAKATVMVRRAMNFIVGRMLFKAGGCDNKTTRKRPERKKKR